MVRLVGVDLPRNKKNYLFSYLYSWNWSYICKKIVELANINPDTRTSDLTTEETSCITSNFRRK
jgi:ribosomal protein S13